MIELRQLTKTYGARKDARGVFNVDLQAPDGAITGILGLNGAGKTTLIKAVCGIHCKTSGKILLDGAEATELELRAASGLVPERPLLYESFTVREFLHTAAELRGIPKTDIPAAARHAIKKCKLEEYADTRISALSKGFCQRVSFAQATIHNPAVLVLDEPAGGLDPAQIVQTRALIRESAASRTVILCTHLMQEAEALCGTIYVISNGKIIAHGTAVQLCAQAKARSLEEAFLKLTDAPAR